MDEDPDPLNEIQILYIGAEQGQFGLSKGGGEITIDIKDDDHDPENELQDLVLNGNELSLTLSDVTVAIPDGETDLSVAVINSNQSAEIYSSTGDGITLNAEEDVIELVGTAQPSLTFEIKIAEGGISTSKLEDGAVKNEKIYANAITVDKLPPGAGGDPDKFLNGNGDWVIIGPGITDLSVSNITGGVLLESSTGNVGVEIHGVEGIEVNSLNPTGEFNIGIEDGGVTIDKLANVTSDPDYFLNGLGEWVEINEGVQGSGTENYVVKWGAGGTTLENSQIFANSTSVGIGTVTPDPNAILHLVGRVITKFPDANKNNIVFGVSAGNDAQTGVNNLFAGYQSGKSNIGGINNIFIGYDSGKSNTSGNSNIFLGFSAGENNTTGIFNNFLGSSAGAENISGNHNVFMGNGSGGENKYGHNNIFLGQSSGNRNVGGSGAVAIGFYSQQYVNGQEEVFNNYNVSVGYKALRGSDIPSENTGNENVAVGASSLDINKTGRGNVSIGHRAMETHVHGNFNTAIGYMAKVQNGEGPPHNAGAFGNEATAVASNTIRIGNNNITQIGGIVGWTNLSDGRFKMNVTEDVPGLEFISLLRPVTYNLDLDSLQHHMTSQMPDSIAELYYPSAEEIAHADTTVRTGFIAQEVDSVANSINYDFDGVYRPQNSTDNYSLSYSSFVPSLVKAIQEQQVIIESQEATIDSLTTQINQLTQAMTGVLQRLDDLESE
ncbi:MAG: tail fiber domain-containing protein [Saprospiraceae bacterium]|nr:tail fiber domain-containing protein [Saprospiraceae bacterium]